MKTIHFMLLGAVAFLFVACSRPKGDEGGIRFDFGSESNVRGYVQVTEGMAFDAERGFGFESGYQPEAISLPGQSGSLLSDGVGGEESFFFSVAVPEGNHRVRLILAAGEKDSEVTVKAELRRLMVESLRIEAGTTKEVTFLVNTRQPNIAAIDEIEAGRVKLKEPREVTQEAWAWDDLLTLEFSGKRPIVCSLEVEPVDVPTVFLIGDSTVCDQSREPYTSWGQMITAFFKAEVAIANHAESGETYRDSLGRRRLDKILSVMKPGDYLFMQFGHNDQKQIKQGTGGPFTTYKEEMKAHVLGARSRGGVPVIVSSMERLAFDDQGRALVSLGEYAAACKQVAEELGVAFIDLNEPSRLLYEALESRGEGKAEQAFAPGDRTHHNNFGAYQIAKIVAQGIADSDLGLKAYLVDGFSYDPANPDSLDQFAVPASPIATNLRPLGD
ncbi:rhamnogalacturonan acetylesterase [Pelagicoccus enzymogenes]|uniref:rhamnogalacturonan acetylesterase n=1 Tax=Pelagicoccus enzymogenes TaxID=2773457 RepID=UPI00280C8751|nr:rhamnogalacturonan acetylesterase [Pelagicoccus enzymogenes]MDQ8199642.1 rhamnogalacturonan acetylesterase [Pelagicoccus enzymogenes]